MRVQAIEKDHNCKCGRAHFIVNQHPSGEHFLISLEDYNILRDKVTFLRDAIEDHKRDIELSGQVSSEFDSTLWIVLDG